MKIRRLSMLVMAAVLILVTVLAGCSGGSNNAEGTTNTEEASGSGNNADNSDEAPVDANKSITVTYYTGGRAETTPDPNNETNKYILETIKEKTGVELKLEPYDFADQFNQRLNQFAASKKIPTGVWQFPRSPFTTDVLNDMGRAGMLWDLSEFVNNSQTMRENAEELFLKLNTNKDDGKLYVFPAERHRSFPHAPGGIAVRKDWVEESGLAYPQNEEDLYNLIKYFRENRKNDAGKPVAPVGFNQFAEISAWLNHWMGTISWVKIGDHYELAKYSKVPELKQAILFLNRLWREDMIDKESFTMKPEQFVEKASNGTIGVAPYTFGGIYPANDALTKQYPDTNKYWISVPPFAATSSITVDEVNSFELISEAYNNIVITKDIPKEDVQRIISMIDYIGTYDGSLLTLFGIENKDWVREGEKIVKTDSYKEKIATDINYQWKAGLALYSRLNPNPKALQDLLNGIATRQADIESVTNIKGHQIALSEPIHVAPAGEIELKKMPLIDKEWTKMFIDAVTASSAEKAASIVDAWPNTRDNLGYQDILKERNETAQNMMK